MKIILTESQYKRILKEGMYINDKGELMDDSDNTPVDKSFHIPNGTEIVDVLIYVGTDEFVIPGHYGEAAVLKWFGDTDDEGEGVIIRENVEEEGSVETLHMKGKLEWNDKYDIHNFYPYYPKEEKEEPTPLGEKELEYVITFGPDDNKMPKWMNRLGQWVNVDDETFEEGEDVYNSWEEWIGSPYFKEDGGLDTSSGKEGDWIKKSALHSTRFGENYLKQYLKNGPMRVKRYRK
ncbi:hypothetical protein N9F18_00710 [bacterium]|jgi:hypothetical protein|nr:hypothetical protein [bacterium]